MRNEMVLIVLVMLVAGSLGAGYLMGSMQSATKTGINSTTTSQSSTSTSTVTTTSVSTATRTATVYSSFTTTTSPGTQSSTNGLQLTASINATSLLTGQNLEIKVSLYNDLPSQLNLSTSDNWVVSGFPVAMWPGCYAVLPPNNKQPIEFMIVKGNYSVNQLHTLSTNTSVPEGGCMEGGRVSHLLFSPLSSIANLTGTFCTAACFPIHNARYSLTSNFTVNGYWSYPINSSEAQDILRPPNPPCYVDGHPDCLTFNYPEVGPVAQQTFTPALYTLVVSDEWGQAVVIHFTVS
jgi:hypothetical protein